MCIHLSHDMSSDLRSLKLDDFRAFVYVTRFLRSAFSLENVTSSVHQHLEIVFFILLLILFKYIDSITSFTSEVTSVFFYNFKSESVNICYNFFRILYFRILKKIYMFLLNPNENDLFY